MSKFSQLLKMIKILEGAEKPIKRKDVAEMLEVSPRMVRKYIDDLKESGYNVISTSGRKGGLQIEGAKEPEQMKKNIKLTLDEYILIKSLLEQNRIEVNQQLEKVLDNEYEDKKDYTPIKRLLIRQLTDIQNINNKIKELL